jgi:hypothetical protein
MNNLAIYTGVRVGKLSKFIRKYNLDLVKLTTAVMKDKNVRKDLAAAVSGYDDNELAQDFASKYTMNEGIRAEDFYASTVGKAILRIIRKNNGHFNGAQVSQLLDNLNPHDLKWARQMDAIAISVGLDISRYETYGDQLPDMLNAMEKLYLELKPSRIITTKKEINEMIEKAANETPEIPDNHPRRLIINVPQFEYLVNQILNPLNTLVTLSEGILDDTYTFEVYSSRMKKFNDFMREYPNFRITKLKRDSDYLYITVNNSGRFIEWVPLVTFYKEHIKI